MNLKTLYKTEIVSSMRKQFHYKSIEQVPKIIKIVINRGVGDALKNSKELEVSIKEFATITGQQPKINKAKKSIANFKIRDGMPVGISVTLRKEKMYTFFTKLIHITLPRIKDFQGISSSGFDGRGNYTFGLSEQLIFPEINYDDVNNLKGFDISIITTAKTDDEAFTLLKKFGMPFKLA